MNRPGRSNPRRARLVWVVAATVAAAVVALALTAAGVDELEVLATVLFVVVFSAALLGGRTAGFLAAAACAAAYLVLRSQDVDAVGAPATGLLVVTRAACYVAVAQLTQLLQARFPPVDLPARLPTNWDVDDAPVPTALYAGPAGSFAAERAAPARWDDADAAGAAAWVDDGADEATDFATAAAAAGWAPDAPVDGASGFGHDPWAPPRATAGVDAGGAGWDQPTGVLPEVPFAPPEPAPASPERLPWEVDLDTGASTAWAPGAYDRPPAPSMPTGWIDDATSPLGDESIPVGYTGELFIAREMARGPSGGRPLNGGPTHRNGDHLHRPADHRAAGHRPADHRPADLRASNGGPPAAGVALPRSAVPPPAPVPPVPSGPPGGSGRPGSPGPSAGGGFGVPGSPPPPPASPAHPATGGGAGRGYVPMSDPSEGIDPETRLWNARFFRERLATARDAAVQTGAGFSVVMIQVPDQPFQSLPYRRQVALLRELGHQFVSARLVDHLVHLPDESQHWFAVVLAGSDRASAVAFERRLRSTISGYLRNRGLHISEIQSLSLTSPDDDEAMSMVWSSLLGGPSGDPAMAYDSQA